MASFANPLSEGNPQEWLNYSKEAQQPESNKSMEFLAKGVEAGAQGLETADRIASNYVTQKSSAGASKILQEETENLQSILPDSSKPAELKAQANERAGMIDEARRANGAISNTHFLATLDRYAKDESSNYSWSPHLQEAVRKGIAEATGVGHTANELRESIQKDLNSYLTAKDHQADKVYNEVFQNKGEPGFQEHEKALRNKEPGAVDNAVDWIQKVNAGYARIKRDNEEMNNDKNNRDYRERFAEDSFRSWGGGKVNDYLHSAVADGMGLKTDQDIIDAFRAHSEGKKMMSATQADQLAQVLEAHRAQVAMRLTQLGNQAYVDPKTGKPMGTWGSTLGGKFNGIVDELTAPYKIAGSWIKDHDVGALGAVTRWNKAFGEDTKMSVLQSEMGAPMANIEAVRSIVGPEISNNLVSTAYKQGLSDKVTGLLATSNARSLMSTEDLRKAKLPGAPPSMQETIDTFKKQGIRDPRVFNNLVEHVSNISNPKLEDKAKANLIVNTFNPKNLDTIKTWAAAGQPGIFESMVSPSNIQEAKRLDTKYPGTFDHIKSWGTDTFKTIAQRQLLDLNQFQKTSGDQLHYDDTTQQFEYKNTGATVTTPAGAVGVGRKNPFVDRTVQDLNRGLRVIREIARAENPDPAHVNAYVYETLRSFGYDEPGAPEGYNKDMIQAIRATAAEAVKAREETIKSFKEKKKNDNR